MAAKKTLEKKTDEDIKKTEAKEEVVEKVKDEPVKEKKKMVIKDIDPDEYVVVRNGFQGELNYVNRKTGELLKWREFGDEQEMTLRDLRYAKNSEKAFFINNWFMFDEDWIVDYLGLKQYYKYSVPIDKFDDLFEKPADELKEVLSNMPEGQKKSLAYRARQLIAENKIDSLNVVSVLEKCLGIDLIER